jgi:hypothetical protein
MQLYIYKQATNLYHMPEEKRPSFSITQISGTRETNTYNRRAMYQLI